MATYKKSKQNPHADLTRKVLQQMKEHGTGWVKPWSGQMAGGGHHNCVTGNYYSGGNVFMLMDSRSKKWATQTLDGQPTRAGSLPTRQFPKAKRLVPMCLTPMPVLK